MNGSPRIKDLSLTTMDVIMLMSDGNHGAVAVMCELMQKTDKIDPDAALGGLGAILSLDTHGIYGPRIWQFYKDVCGQNLNRMLGLMRAVQLGYLGESKLSYAIDTHGAGLDIPALLSMVKERLPAFALSEGGAKAA
jgi:hypothetical protein